MPNIGPIVESRGCNDSGESSVKISRIPRISAILICALTLVFALLETLRADGTQLDHYVWSTVASPQGAGSPFIASLTASDAGSSLVSNYFGNVTVSAKVFSSPSLVISEVDNGTTNRVEFTNPSTNWIDVSGWNVAFYDQSKYPQPTKIFTIPAGTVCPPQSVFVIAAGGAAPGIFPTFFIGSPLFWTRSGSNPTAVSLLNQTNGLVDFFCAAAANPYLITNPVPVIPGGWLGAATPLNANQTYSYQRQGYFNHRQAVDWFATNRSIGILNSNLSLPFTANYLPIAVSPGSVVLTNGVWSGYVSVQTPGSNVLLHADNGSGNPGVSNPFDVVPGPSVLLSLPTQTFDSNPGVQQATIGISSAIAMDVVFNLASSIPSKIGVPPTVVVTAGTTSAMFNVTNFNDLILDGIQLVTVTASNYLFSMLQGIITNFSAPVQLQLTLPNAVNQKAGMIVGQGQLSTSVSVGENFQAKLFSSDANLLSPPQFVHIPAGQTNVSFSMSAANGPQILGNREVIVTAFAGPGTTTSGSITVLGNQSSNLTLLLPARLIEGAGAVSNATITIGGTLLTNLSIHLTSSTPGALQVSANVVLLAGQTSAVVPMVVPPNPAPGQNLLVTVSASAAGFVDGNGSIVIQDNQVDHFGIAGIPLDQTANQPFAVSILAQNQSGDTITNFSGTASLFAIGLASGSIVPGQTDNFTNGVWIGTISIPTVATNVVVGAQAGSISGQSNPFNVGPVFISTIDAAIADLICDPGTDRIYATIPASSGSQSNTVMRLNPHTASVEAYIPVDTNPGLMALSASNQYIYVSVQSGYSVQRINLALQLPDLEFALPTDFPTFYAVNMVGLPNSPASVAIAGQSPYGPSADFIYDGGAVRTNLTDLAMVPGLDNKGILSGGLVYLWSGVALNPTNQAPVGQFVAPGVGVSRPAPDPGSGSVFFLSQQSGQTVIFAFDIATFTLQGSQTIPGVVGTAQHLVRWGTNGLAFSTTGNQLFLVRSSLFPGPSAAELSVSQNAPVLATIGNALSYTISITNSGVISASDVVLYDLLPTGASFVSASSSQGTVQASNGVLSGSFGTIPPNAAMTLTVTVQAQTPGILENLVSVATSSVDSNSARRTSTWLTTVSGSASSNQIAQLLLPINDLVSNPTDGKLYASVSGAAASFGNCIVAIDPLTLQISNPVFVGSEPGALALSQNGRYLYIYLQSSTSIELVDLQTGSVDFQHSIYGNALTEMFVLPGGSNSLLLSQYDPRSSPSGRGILIITDGETTVIPDGLSLIQPSLSSNVFYCYSHDTVPSRVGRIEIDGTNAVSTYAGGLTLDVKPEIRSGGNLLFFSSGEVVDPESMIRLATFPGLASSPFGAQPLNHICPDIASGRVYYLKANGSIAAYSLNSYQLTGTLPVTGIIGTPGQLVRWGVNGFAFATSGGQLFSIQTAIVPTNQTADLVINQTTAGSATLLTNFTVTLTVSNQGPGVATGVVAYDVLPTGMRFLSASSTQGGISTNGGTLTAILGILNAGATAQISIHLRPDAISSSFNYVRVAANEPDPVMTNNSSWQPVEIATYFSQNLPLYVGDLVYDPSRGKVFATVHSAGAYSNSIIQIDPQTGNVERSLPTNFEPGKIDITADGQFLYVGTTQEGCSSWSESLS